MPTDDLYSLPSLPYDLDALEPVISSRTMQLHHGTHHAAYVKAANELTGRLGAVPPDGDPSALSRALSFNLSGHRLHSLFWQCLSPNGGGSPPPGLAGQLVEHFGSVELVIGRMTATLERLSGSGWAALVWEPVSQRLIVTQVHDHQHDHVIGATPILVIDGWEHAYYLQYEADRAKWAKAFWDVVDWAGVSTRLDAVVPGVAGENPV